MNLSLFSDFGTKENNIQKEKNLKFDNGIVTLYSHDSHDKTAAMTNDNYDKIQCNGDHANAVNLDNQQQHRMETSADSIDE